MVLAIGGAGMMSKSLIGKYTFLFISVILIFMAVSGLIVYGSIQSYFEEDAFESIEYAMESSRILGLPSPGRDVDAKSIQMNATRGVHSAYLFVNTPNGGMPQVRGPALAPSYNDFSKSILNSKEEYTLGQRYVQTINDEKIYFILSYVENETRDGDPISYYVLSFMTESHVIGLTQAIFSRFAVVMIAFVAVVAIIAYLMLNTFRRKFKVLDEQISRISKRDWQVPVVVEDHDEFSRIQERLEEVRERLLYYDNEMKHQFHSVSHEFKTPIMIIRGYVDATLQGKYPKGSLEASLKVIDDEMIKLSDMVNKVLYLNKIDYMTKDQVDEWTDVYEIVEDKLTQYEPLNENVKWALSGSGRKYRGTVDQWDVVISNLLDNQMRYAASKIEITLDDEITIYNDGPEIEEAHLQKVFNSFFKGVGGQSGLGLAIVKKNLSVNGYKISVDNVCPGVKFKIISDKSPK